MAIFHNAKNRIHKTYQQLPILYFKSSLVASPFMRCYHIVGWPGIGLIGRLCFLFMQQATMPPMVSATVVSMKKAAMAHGTVKHI